MATAQNFEFYQGDTFKLPLILRGGSISGTPLDLTGYSARMQARTSLEAAEAVIELSSAVGEGIVLGGVAGTLELKMTPEQTALFAVGCSDGRLPAIQNYVYDIEIRDPAGEVYTIMQGSFSVMAGVTR